MDDDGLHGERGRWFGGRWLSLFYESVELQVLACIYTLTCLLVYLLVYLLTYLLTYLVRGVVPSIMRMLELYCVSCEPAERIYARGI